MVYKKYYIVAIFFLTGFCLGMFYDSIIQTRYNLGFVSFCDLKEKDRLRVCPKKRQTFDFSHDGSIIIYTCNENTKYIVANKLSGRAKVWLKETMKSFENRNVYEQECKTDSSIVYKAKRRLDYEL